MPKYLSLLEIIVLHISIHDVADESLETEVFQLCNNQNGYQIGLPEDQRDCKKLKNSVSLYNGLYVEMSSFVTL